MLSFYGFGKVHQFFLGGGEHVSMQHSHLQISTYGWSWRYKNNHGLVQKLSLGGNTRRTWCKKHNGNIREKNIHDETVKPINQVFNLMESSIKSQHSTNLLSLHVLRKSVVQSSSIITFHWQHTLLKCHFPFFAFFFFFLLLKWFAIFVEPFCCLWWGMWYL